MGLNLDSVEFIIFVRLYSNLEISQKFRYTWSNSIMVTNLVMNEIIQFAFHKKDNLLNKLTIKVTINEKNCKLEYATFIATKQTLLQ